MGEEVPTQPLYPRIQMTHEPFDRPLDDHEVLRELYKDMKEVRDQVRLTNGRVTRLEQFRWAMTGALLIIGMLIVPIFLDLVLNGVEK